MPRQTREKITDGAQLEQLLHHWFDLFNKHFYESKGEKLPDVIITFTGTPHAFGHMTSVPVWNNSEGEDKYELNIDAHTLNRAPEKICATLLHEMAHLYNAVHGISDTSNSGFYHNSNYRKTAEDHGLNVERDERYGWSITTLSEEAVSYINTLALKPITFSRKKGSRRHNLIRFVCPLHEKAPYKVIVYMSSDKPVCCGICGSSLVAKPK